MRIFVPALQKTVDYEELKKLGRVIPLLNPGIPKVDPNALIKSFSKSLKNYNFDPENDCIACVPPLLWWGMLISVALVEFDFVDILIYQNVQNTYIKKRCTIESVHEDTSEKINDVQA